MVKYEDLERQLRDAKSQAEQAEEEQELARAAAAVARSVSGGSSGTLSEDPECSLDEAAGAAVGSPSCIVSDAGETTGDAAQAAVSGWGWGVGSETPPGAAVQPHVDKVRALEEQLSEVRDVVHLGDMSSTEESEEEEEKGARRRYGSGP